MSRKARHAVRLFTAGILAALATAALTAGVALAGGGGPPLPH